MGRNKSYVGIDPGKTGALCCLEYTDGRKNPRITFFDWPKKGTVVDVLQSICSSKKKMAIFHAEHAVLEMQQSMHKQGVKSVFSIGRNFGCWEGLLVALEIPFIIVAANVWQKGHSIKKSDGPDSKSRVRNALLRRFPPRKFPKLHKKLYGPKGKWKDGRADALFIALYAKENIV